ncbi:MAG: DUF861 domain-containing protein [Candidatus Lokiarchaeota archaeon]|nr:DUF861 domain-containing protein [Candidatus Lokiarchaeota archaeon]
MKKVKVKKPSEVDLEKLGVKNWGIWEKEQSKFDWSYNDTETFYVIEGEVEVETEDGQKVEFESGDLVQFPKGTNCVWLVKKPIRKHYKFGDLEIDDL